MTRNGRGKEIGAVDIDGKQLTHAVNGVVDGLEVLREAGRRDEAVDFAVRFKDFGDTGGHAVSVADVGVVSCYFG